MLRQCIVTAKSSARGKNRSHARNKTCRSFRANIHFHKTHLEGLGSCRLKISPRGLRSIVKKGGMENFLLSTPTRKLSTEAKRIKKRLEIFRK